MIECKVVVPLKVGQDVIELIWRDLTAAFGGVQSTQGAGLWCDPDQGGKVVAEAIVTMIVAVPRAEEYCVFHDIVTNHCRAAGERYLYISRAEGRAEIIPLTEENEND